MERKRKLPARASARVEHIAKKRNVTPPEHRSATPTSAPTPPPAPAPAPAPDPPPSLPKSIQPGKLLPTVEDAQPDDLPLKDYQNIQESGVLAESLQRSRQRWIAEGIFEKYWAKPVKRKGVVTEEPNNPPKDSMFKIGQVVLTIEPHVFEANMYAVKNPKPPPPATPATPKTSATPAATPTTQATFRPIMQYGPPNGTMPPPPTPKTEATTPALPATEAANSAPPQSPAQASPVPQQSQSRLPSASQEPPRVPPSPQGPGPTLAPARGPAPSPTPAAVNPSFTAPSHSPVSANAPKPASPAPNPGPSGRPPPSTPSNLPAVPAASSATAALPGRATPTPTQTPNQRPPSSTPTPTMGAAKPVATPKAPGTDPIIMTLAEKASEDSHLRDLMKRVAAGEAKPDELANFQRIIDQITAEYKKKGGQQGPSADRLIVDGKTVKYFGDEVRTILDIVLTTNPQQKSSELLPPPGSDPLVVALVKSALDDLKVQGMIRRIADNQPGFTDATDLKAVLDKLHKALQSAPPPPPPPPKPQPQPLPSPQVQAVVNGTPNGPAASPSRQTQPVQPVKAAQPVQPVQQHPLQQALRSKGPPPAPKPDVSAVVFEFSGGNGDRYLFPKFSILEYMPGGQQLIASFLIVRKGSQLEYGGDDKLDYYQPVTIRLSANAGRHLDYLNRVVAPPDEVRRYMDDVMDNMTRAEYVLLAMRLPRGEPPEKDASTQQETTGPNGTEAALVASPTLPAEPAVSAGPTKPPVLWGPNVTAFLEKFESKESYDDFTASKRKSATSGVLVPTPAVYENACSLLGLDESDFADYDKIIEGLAAKDDEASS